MTGPNESKDSAGGEQQPADPWAPPAGSQPAEASGSPWAPPSGDTPAQPQWGAPASGDAPAAPQQWGQPAAGGWSQQPGGGAAAPWGAQAGTTGDTPAWGQQPGQQQPGQPGAGQQQWGQQPGQQQPGWGAPQGQQWGQQPAGAPGGPQQPGAAGAPGGKSKTPLILAGVGVLAVVVVVLLGIALFGNFGTATLESGAAEAGVSKVLTESYGATQVGNVSCPDGQEVASGNSFDCTVTVDGQHRTVTLTFTDDNGTYEVSRPH